MERSFPTPAGTVDGEITRGADHRPGAPLVVLAHGAGSDRRHPALVRIADAIAAAGYGVCRFDFPYRRAGRRIPDRMPVLLAAYGAVLDALRADPSLAPAWVALGGRSLGGRVASHLVAAGARADALLFLSFPLHPARRPDTARAAHLAVIRCPMLFVQGTRDALAEWPLLQATVDALPRATLHALPDGDHALAVPRRTRAPEAVDAEVDRAVVAWLDRVRGVTS